MTLSFGPENTRGTPTLTQGSGSGGLVLAVFEVVREEDQLEVEEEKG